MTDELIIGMLSGTSRDGVDAVLVNFSNGSMDILHARCTPYPPAIKKTLDQLLETGAAPSRQITELLDENLAYFFARVAQNLRNQLVHHIPEPASEPRPAYSLDEDDDG